MIASKSPKNGRQLISSPTSSWNTKIAIAHTNRTFQKEDHLTCKINCKQHPKVVVILERVTCKCN
uniref:Uncharacterized protein n=1 Tax=Rhizophora mucronata TaxID=61149 RepID=A0A2P2NYW6_RHIMU